MSTTTTSSSSVTIVIPRATPRAESLAENIAKLQDAEATLSEKLKKVREAKLNETKELQAWMQQQNAPLDIPVSLGPGRTATLYEKETKGSISVSYLTEVLTEALGEERGQQMVTLIYDSRPSEIETQIKFTDVVKIAEAKKRRAEEAKLNPKPKKPRAKKSTAAAASSSPVADEYDDDE